MASIKELRAEQAKIATNARAKFDEITDKTDEARAAEIEREFDAMMADHDKIGAKLERLEKLEGVESRLKQGDSRKPNGSDAEQRGIDEAEPITYRDAFHAYLRSRGVAEALPADVRAVLAAGYNKVEARAQTTTAAEGGYMVPTELANIMVKSMLAWGPMYDPGVTTELVTSGGGTITMPTVNDTASVIVKHVQGTTLTDDGGSDVVFGQKQLDAYAFNTAWLRVSKELVDDSPFAVETLLGELLGERLGRRANTELTVGDGTGDPNGIVTASSLGKTAAGVNAVTADEIIDLLHSVDPAYRQSPKAAFMFNDSTLAAIRKLKDGNGNYLWQMGNVQNGVPGSLLGYRYYINQAMASLATGQKVAVFGDFGKYFVRKVGSPLIGAIQDKDFWPGFGVAGYIRFDGELADTAAVKHLITA
jgi:HK97 family phage major capsid protein